MSYPKTYKGKLTKRQKEKEKQKFALAFLIALITVFGSYLMTEASRTTEVHIGHTKGTHPNIEQERIAEQRDVSETHSETQLPVKERLRIEAREECNKRDLGEYCVDDLMGMVWTESRFNPDTVGDNGSSHGLFQIHLGYHPNITKKQARKIGFSVEWTLNRMVEKYNYPEYRSIAIRGHNGSPNNPRTLTYLRSVNNY